MGRPRKYRMLSGEDVGPPIHVSNAPPGGGCVTAAEAEERFGIPARRVRVWKHRGRIKPVGKRGGSPLYRLNDLRRLFF